MLINRNKPNVFSNAFVCRKFASRDFTHGFRLFTSLLPHMANPQPLSL